MRAVFAALGLALSTPAAADTLLDNVEGIALDATGHVERFTGMVIDGAGKVVKLLKRGDKRPERPQYRIDGKGRVAIPGMIDSHSQLIELGLSTMMPVQGTVSTASRIPSPRPEDRDVALAAAQDLLLRQGITAAADLGATIEDWQTYRRAGDTGALRIRIMAYARGVEAMELIGGPGPTPWLYHDRLRLNGVALSADGTSGTGSIQLRNLMSRAAIDRFQIAIDASSTRAVTEALSAFEELAQTYKGERRWRIEGARMVDPAIYARFGSLGVVASMQPASLADDIATGTTGPAGTHAWASLSQSGARLAFGSDSHSKIPHPFADMATAITRQNAAGQPYGGWLPEERLTRETALAAWTAGGAWAGMADGRFGRLAVGEWADFVLLDRDPLLASPSELRAVRVEEVWIGGQRAFRAEGAN